MELLTEDEARTRIRVMIESRDWWVMPWLTDRAGDQSTEIEKAYYAGEANVDFLAMMAPLPVTFAHKRRMSPEQLGALLAEICPSADRTAEEWTEFVQTQDVLIAMPSEDPDTVASVVALALAWHDWVMA